MRPPITFTALLLALVALALVACLSSQKTHKGPEGYRIVGFDAATHQWTILRNGTFGGKYLVKRITAVCLCYQWDNHKTVYGPDACNFQVGQIIVPNPLPPPGEEDKLVDIWEMGGGDLSVTVGHGENRVQQLLKIVNEEVLPNK